MSLIKGNTAIRIEIVARGVDPSVECCLVLISEVCIAFLVVITRIGMVTVSQGLSRQRVV